MVLGYILVGAFAGLSAFTVALFLGASFWLAFGLYALLGAATVFLLCAVQMVASVFASRIKGSFITDHWNETSNPHSVVPLGGQQEATGETSMRILTVDDDPFILELIPMISAKAGFPEVTSAASGEQALKLLGDTYRVFDCLLFDINMPGMDGIELCRRAREIPRYSRTPILMLTAMRDMKNMGKAFRAGATDYVTKPFEIEELGTRLRLAQDAISAPHQTNAGEVQSAKYPLTQTPADAFKLPDLLRPDVVPGLVDHAVLSNYLTQLPRKEVAEVLVFAVSVDGMERVQTQFRPQQFVSLLEDVAKATADSFGVDQTVMAYNNRGILLIATNAINLPPPNTLEGDIERRIGDFSAQGAEVSVSIGGPVQALGQKNERASIACDRAIGLAENRMLNKKGRSVAGLFRH